LKILLRANLIN